MVAKSDLHWEDCDHAEMCVTKVQVTCHTVHVTISKFHCVNAPIYYCHLDKTCPHESEYS